MNMNMMCMCMCMSSLASGHGQCTTALRSRWPRRSAWLLTAPLPDVQWDASWAGGTALLAPDLHDAPWLVSPRPRRLLLFSSTIPHYARAPSASARPFAPPHEKLHRRHSLVFKVQCKRSATTADPHRGMQMAAVGAATASTELKNVRPGAARPGPFMAACVACWLSKDTHQPDVLLNGTQWFASHAPPVY